MLCTSGFIDDVIIAHKPRQLNVAAQLMEAQPTCSLGLGYKQRVGIPVADQWTDRTTFRAPSVRSLRLVKCCKILFRAVPNACSIYSPSSGPIFS